MMPMNKYFELMDRLHNATWFMGARAQVMQQRWILWVERMEGGA